MLLFIWHHEARNLLVAKKSSTFNGRNPAYMMENTAWLWWSVIWLMVVCCYCCALVGRSCQQGEPRHDLEDNASMRASAAAVAGLELDRDGRSRCDGRGRPSFQPVRRYVAPASRFPACGSETSQANGANGFADGLSTVWWPWWRVGGRTLRRPRVTVAMKWRRRKATSPACVGGQRRNRYRSDSPVTARQHRASHGPRGHPSLTSLASIQRCRDLPS